MWLQLTSDALYPVLRRKDTDCRKSALTGGPWQRDQDRPAWPPFGNQSSGGGLRSLGWVELVPHSRLPTGALEVDTAIVRRYGFSLRPPSELCVNPLRRYLLISPCRDEAQYLRRTLDSVAAQSVPPALWLVV